MGVLICLGGLEVLNKGDCLQPPDNTYTKLEQTRDGLEVYKSNSYDLYDLCRNKYSPNIKCPLCLKPIPNEETSEIKKLILEKSPQAMGQLVNDYNYIVSNYSIDIFNVLEEKYNKYYELLNGFDDRKYFKLICQNKNNKQCYLILYNLSKEEFEKKYPFKINDERYIISKWKNDSNYKNKLIEEREKEYKKFQEREKIRKFKEHVEEKRKEIKKEWEEITFKKEYDKYLNQLRFIDNDIDSGRFGNPKFGTVFDLSFIFNNHCNAFKYIGAKLKIAQYISKYSKNNSDRDWFLIKAKPFMSEEEKKEYLAYEQPRLPKMTIIIDPSKAEKI